MSDWWQKPELRTDEDEGRERRVTWLELFYDLIFVVVVAELAHVLAADVSLAGAFGYCLLFVPAAWLWVGGTFYNDRFDTEDISHRVFTFAQMIPVAALAIFAHDARGKTAEEYALAYAAGRFLLVLLWLRGGFYNKEFRPVSRRYAVGYSLAVALWTASALVDESWRWWLWAAALAADLLTPVWTLPHQKKLPEFSSSHLPERFGLFTIIVLGEAVAGVVRGLASIKELTARPAVTGVFGIALAFALWWIYFDFVARRLAKPNVKWSWFNLYAHLPLLMSIGAVGAGVQAVVQSEAEGLAAGERWLICGAVGATLIAIGLLEYGLPEHDDDDPINHYLSAPLKITLGIAAPLIFGWNQSLGAFAILGALLGLLLIPVLYGTIHWFQAPAAEREKHSVNNNEGTDDDTLGIKENLESQRADDFGDGR